MKKSSVYNKKATMALTGTWGSDPPAKLSLELGLRDVKATGTTISKKKTKQNKSSSKPTYS